MLPIKVYNADCVKWLQKATPDRFHLSFLDPPFNQGKDYRHFNDKQQDAVYWQWMTDILSATRRASVSGGWVYFMQREKNVEFVLRALRESGWKLQNLIIWKKMTSAVPCKRKFGLNYQIIASATNGNSARVFHRLRITPAPRPNHKLPAPANGVYVTDVWDDIRELTAGYFAGAEALRTNNGERFHKQQTPLALLGRIILSSSKPGDIIFDPFSGTGTTPIAATLLGRKGIAVELDPINVDCIRARANAPREADTAAIAKLYDVYAHTNDFAAIWSQPTGSKKTHIKPDLFADSDSAFTA